MSLNTTQNTTQNSVSATPESASVSLRTGSLVQTILPQYEGQELSDKDHEFPIGKFDMDYLTRKAHKFTLKVWSDTMDTVKNSKLQINELSPELKKIADELQYYFSDRSKILANIQVYEKAKSLTGLQKRIYDDAIKHNGINYVYAYEKAILMLG